ncbi:MAG: tripartite tricarboxylate transporter substrate binding protein [Betaproteobacteria bacterium]|nr:tripartite tricarboxylate transporter substrate binding protein [Betaproteobacteria bacterium]
MHELKKLLRLFAVGVLIASGAVHAQNWPNQTIRIIVPFPPGGTTDQVGRLLQPYLQQSLGVPVVVDNRGGASGAIGSGMAAKAPPDGNTFLLVFDTHGVNPSLIPNMPFDTLKDLAPIMLIGKSPMVITAHPSFPYKTFTEVVKLARARPGEVAFGSIGSGSLAHLAMAMISGYAKVEITHIPYKGGGPLVINAIGGHVPLGVASLALFSPHIQSGRLKAIGITSPKRHPQFPNVATVAEQVMPGFEAEAWWGLLAPVNTPVTILTRMHAEVTKALKTPALQQHLDQQSLAVTASSPDEFQKFLVNEVERWARVVRDNKIKPGE